MIHVITGYFFLLSSEYLSAKRDLCDGEPSETAAYNYYVEKVLQDVQWLSLY